MAILTPPRGNSLFGCKLSAAVQYRGTCLFASALVFAQLKNLPGHPKSDAEKITEPEFAGATGRLMLNIVISFAEHESSVKSERPAPENRLRLRVGFGIG